jgi:hypothetical protein
MYGDCLCVYTKRREERERELERIVQVVKDSLTRENKRTKDDEEVQSIYRISKGMGMLLI